MRINDSAAWNDHARDDHNRMSRQQMRDYMRQPLSIPTPKTTPELRKRWHGMPPSRPTLAPRVGDTMKF